MIAGETRVNFAFCKDCIGFIPPPVTFLRPFLTVMPITVLNMKLKSYSLISIRQNYNFDILATIWNEFISWFMMISQDLRDMIIVFVLFFISVQNNFMIATNKDGEKTQKSTNNAIHIKWWLKYRNNRLVSWRLSCTL